MSIRITSVSSSTAEKKGMPLEWSPGGAAVAAALVAAEEGEVEEEAAAATEASAMAADEAEAFGLTLEQEGPL